MNKTWKKNVSLAIAALLTAGTVVGLAGCGGAKTPASSQAVSAAAPAKAPEGKPGAAVVHRSADVKYSVPSGVSILMYHMIGNIKNNAAVMTADNLRWQMQYLKDNGFHPITMEELHAYVTKGAPLPEKPVCITFDDGYEDNYTIVYPMMKEYGFPWTFFVITGQVGQANRVTWDQLREMAASRTVTISNHTVTHPKLHNLPSAEKKAEIVNSQAALKKELGIDNVWFCYPYGDYDQEVEQYVKEAGIKLAVTTDSGRVKVGSYPYELKRVWIGNEVNKAHYAERLTKDDYTIL